jgi:hypothetical protein
MKNKTFIFAIVFAICTFILGLFAGRLYHARTESASMVMLPNDCTDYARSLYMLCPDPTGAGAGKLVCISVNTSTGEQINGNPYTVLRFHPTNPDASKCWYGLWTNAVLADDRTGPSDGDAVHPDGILSRIEGNGGSGLPDIAIGYLDQEPAPIPNPGNPAMASTIDR